MAAGLALAAGLHAVISASPQGHSAAVGDVDIIVDGARQPVTRDPRHLLDDLGETDDNIEGVNVAVPHQ
jgi:hypothetical protein